MRATGAFLTQFVLAMPHGLQPAVWILLEALLLLGPAAWGFLFAWRWGWRGGVAAMFVAYFISLWTGISLVSLMSACRPEQHCGDGAVGLKAAWEFIQWAAGAYAISWPWHLLWLAPSGACVWAGLLLRRRRLAVAA